MSGYSFYCITFFIFVSISHGYRPGQNDQSQGISNGNSPSGETSWARQQRDAVGRQTAIVGPTGLMANQGDQTAVIGPNGMQALRGGQTATIDQNGMQAFDPIGGQTAIIGSNGMFANSGASSSILEVMPLNLMGLTGPALSAAFNGVNMVGQTGAISRGNVVSSSNVAAGNGGRVSINGGNFFSNSGSGNSVSQSCNNNVCQTCINNRCFNRGYPSIRTHRNCPAAACEYGCEEFVFVDGDNCPVCRCNGYSTRELCSNQNDCKSSTGNCQDQLCRYPAITGNYVRACDFSYQCTSTQYCNDNRCIPNPNNRRHAENIVCVFVNQCPSGYSTCDGMTCWENTSGSSDDHVSGTSCVFDYQCPTQYSCQGMSCIRTGVEHGTFACVFDTQCNKGQRCINMTCK